MNAIALCRDFLAAFHDAALHNPPLAYGALGTGLFMAIFLFKLFFGDWEGFWECIKYTVQPGMISLFRGEWTDAHWASLKLTVWLLVSGGCGISAFYKLPHWLPHFFHQ